MIEKLIYSKSKMISCALKHINMTPQTIEKNTQLSSFAGLLKKYNPKAPLLTAILKHMKSSQFSVEYLLKCACFCHFCIQHESNSSIKELINFIDQLKYKLEHLAELYGNGDTSLTMSAFKIDRTVVTQSDEIASGKEYFMLKEIISPYLGYLKKMATKRQNQGQQRIIDYIEVWSLVNGLKSISGFTLNFTVIGRYYKKCYGGLVVLLSQVLSFDVKESVDLINSFMIAYYKVLSLSSQKKEDMREVEQFVSLLEEMGDLNDKFSQFYLGKYFYMSLKHLEHPQWLDNNSSQFEHIFKAVQRRQKQEQES